MSMSRLKQFLWQMAEKIYMWGKTPPLPRVTISLLLDELFNSFADRACISNRSEPDNVEHFEHHGAILGPN